MSGFSRGGNVRGGLPPINLDEVFGQPAGDRAPNGDLIDPNSKVKTLETGAGRPKSPDARPQKPNDSGAEEAADRASKEFHAESQLQVLSGEIDEILNKVHSVQVGQMGGRKDGHSDIIIRGMVRDLATKLGVEQKKQNTDSLQGKVARLGDELAKFGPQMADFWNNQVSMNRLNLPN